MEQGYDNNYCTTKLDLFDSEVNPNEIDNDVDRFLDNIQEELVPVDILTGVYPEVKGDNNNLVNTLLTLPDLDLTPIAHSFYKSDYCKGKPLDKSSKAMYASVYNQIVAYNIVNTIWLDLKLMDKSLYTLNFKDTPRYLNQRLIINIVSYIMRSKGINSIVMKQSIFCQKVNTNLCLSDKISSTFDYIKGIVKSDIEDNISNVQLNVKDITDNISVSIFNFKCGPLQNKLYALEEYITELDVLKEKQEELVFESKDKNITVEDVQGLAFRIAKVRADFLFSIGKHNEAVETYLNLTDICKICFDKFYTKNSSELMWLENNCNTGLDLTDKDYEELSVILSHTASKMLDTVHKLLDKYRKTYLALNMELSNEELEAVNDFDDLG